MGEWFVELGQEAQLATWLVASLTLYVLASQIAWHSQWAFESASISSGAQPQHLATERRGLLEDKLEHWVERVRHHPLAPWAEEVARFIYYLGIPFWAAISGWLGADVLGVTGTDWATGKSVQGFLWEDWARGLGLATAAVLGVLGVWVVGRLFSHKAELVPVTQGIPGPLWRRLLDVIYLQIHWAFYRGAPILWLNDVYWGTFVGLALALLEFGFNPAFWWATKSPDTAGPPLIRLGMVWVSTLLFLATQNLWLTASAHLALVILLGGRVADDYPTVDERI